MATISIGNIASTLKAQGILDPGTISKYAKSNGKNSKVSDTPDFVTKGAEKLIEVLRSNINEASASGNFSASTAAEFSEWDISTPRKLADDKYLIAVYATGDLHKDSLWQEGYPDGVENFMDLMNDGYPSFQGAIRPVYGNIETPQGTKRIRSRITRSGVHFIEQSISDFMGNYASEYGVTKISRSLD